MAAPSATYMGVIRRIDTFIDWTGKVVAWACVPLIFANCVEVLASKGFQIWRENAPKSWGEAPDWLGPTDWAGDVTIFAFGTLFMLGAAYALNKGAHVRTDMLWEKFDNRVKGRIDLVAFIVFFFPSMLLIFWFTGDRFLESMAQGERSNLSAWQPVIWPFRGVIPLTALLLMIQGVSEVMKCLHLARTGEFLVQHEKIEV